jgi:hypothetical protein
VDEALLEKGKGKCIVFFAVTAPGAREMDRRKDEGREGL